MLLKYTYILISLLFIGCQSLKKGLSNQVYSHPRYAFSTYIYFHNDSLFTISEGFVVNHGVYSIRKDSLYMYTEEKNLDSFYCDMNIFPVEGNLLKMKLLPNKKIAWKRNKKEDVYIFNYLDEESFNKLDKIECNGHLLIR